MPGCRGGLESTGRAGATGSNQAHFYLPATPLLLCTPHLQGVGACRVAPGGTVKPVLSSCLRGASLESQLPRPSLCLYAEGSMKLWKPLLSLERGARPPPHHTVEKRSAQTTGLLTPPSQTQRMWGLRHTSTLLAGVGGDKLDQRRRQRVPQGLARMPVCGGETRARLEGRKEYSEPGLVPGEKQHLVPVERSRQGGREQREGSPGSPPETRRPLVDATEPRVPKAAPPPISNDLCQRPEGGGMGD